MFVSHAQNLEDVMLWRALGHVEDGFYIDVGSQDPVLHSVSLAFHERGWGGVSVEALPQYVGAMRGARPGAWVIEAALAEEPGRATFHAFAGTGLSTFRQDFAEKHERSGFTSQEIEVTCRTLDSVLEEVEAAREGRPVHWLKIDVEGAEEAVLRGWRESAVRPWIVLVEAVGPTPNLKDGRPEKTHHDWEPILTGHGYQFAYFDGLNRFYVSPEHPELMESFEAGPNLFDQFSLPMASAFVPQLRTRILKQERLTAAQARANADLSRLLADAMRLPDHDPAEPAWLGHLGVLQRSLEALEVEKSVLHERLAAAPPRPPAPISAPATASTAPPPANSEEGSDSGASGAEPSEQATDGHEIEPTGSESTGSETSAASAQSPAREGGSDEEAEPASPVLSLDGAEPAQSSGPPPEDAPLPASDAAPLAEAEPAPDGSPMLEGEPEAPAEEAANVPQQHTETEGEGAPPATSSPEAPVPVPEEAAQAAVSPEPSLPLPAPDNESLAIVGNATEANDPAPEPDAARAGPADHEPEDGDLDAGERGSDDARPEGSS